jgi:hypothetical protein
MSALMSMDVKSLTKISSYATTARRWIAEYW